MRRLVLLAALVLAGCGSDEPESEAQKTPQSDADAVTVVVRPEGDGGPERKRTVECPQDERCAQLRKADFSPPNPTTACTQQFGGPATASVTGQVGGETVKASFDLTNGCSISRWEEFAWLLGPPPGG